MPNNFILLSKKVKKYFDSSTLKIKDKKDKIKQLPGQISSWDTVPEAAPYPPLGGEALNPVKFTQRNILSKYSSPVKLNFLLIFLG